jgi:hypothetical protein
MDALRADAWIADMGDHGDFGRRYVLDPPPCSLEPRLSRQPVVGRDGVAEADRSVANGVRVRPSTS